MNNDILILLTLLIVPLLSASVIAIFLRKLAPLAQSISVLTSIFLAAGSIYFLLGFDGNVIVKSWNWVSLGFLDINFSLLVDDITCTMLFCVTFVAALIHIFSIDYMKNDNSKSRYFGGLSIFMFSIMGIILSGNLFVSFIFWELVGFSSYMLIAHYYETDFAKMASKKAFIVNRIGDLGFLIGIIYCYNTFGTVNFSELKAFFTQNPNEATTALGMLLACGFIGKSAQFPLHVWLPDAMAGPTPVSALIHAATMVSAGIFLMVRLGTSCMLNENVLIFVLAICSLMAFLGGIWALGQTDIKKTLAYSTLAHLGIMGAAVGLGLYGLAMMHLAFHAFFKAALFLSAGSIINACHHEQNMFKMGGLAKKMKITFFVFLIASLAAMAIPFTAGWYSKDSIIAGALLQTNSVFGISIFVLLFLASILTAIYQSRMLWTIFFGKANSDNAKNAKESSFIMILPLLVLAILSLLGGLCCYDLLWADGKMNALIPTISSKFFLSSYNQIHHHIAEKPYALTFEIATFACSLIAIVFALVFYKRGSSEDRLQKICPCLYSQIEKHGYFDIVYDFYVNSIQKKFCLLLSLFDLVFVQTICIRGLSFITSALSFTFRSLQSGNIQSVCYWFVFGVIIYVLISFNIF